MHGICVRFLLGSGMSLTRQSLSPMTRTGADIAGVRSDTACRCSRWRSSMKYPRPSQRAEAELAVELLRPAAVVGDDEDQVRCRRERLLQRVGEDRTRVATPPRFGRGEHILHLRDSAFAS